MNWPQITLIILYTLSLGISIERHGKNKTGRYNFWIDLIASIIVFTILYIGGFFK